MHDRLKSRGASILTQYWDLKHKGLGRKYNREVEMCCRIDRPATRVVRALLGTTVKEGEGGPSRWDECNDTEYKFKMATVLNADNEMGVGGDEDQ